MVGDAQVNPKVTLQLYDHAPGEGETPKTEVLSMTMKKKKKHAQWKVRAANAAGVIYRSQVPEFDKGRKQKVYAGMSLNPQESVKNFLLCRENAGVGSTTGSTAGVEMSNNAAAAKAAQDAAMRAVQVGSPSPLCHFPVTSRHFFRRFSDSVLCCCLTFG